MFDALIEISISTSFMIAVLLLLTPFLAKRYSAKWRYLVWLLLAVRLLIPVNPGLEQTPLALPPLGGQSGAQFPASDQTAVFMTQDSIPAAGVQSQLPVRDIVLIIWAVGAAVFLAWHLLVHINFCRNIKRYGKQADDSTQNVFDGVRNRLNMKTNIQLVVYKGVSGPSVFGFFRNCVVIPEMDLAKADLEAIFSHELVHCKRRDPWFMLLLLIARTAHWFNPLVHVMANAASRDIEISCDEEVLKNTDLAFRRRYAESVLRVIRKNMELKTALSTNFYGGKKSMKQRFASIFDMKTKKKGFQFIAVVVITVFLGGMLVSCSGANAPIAPADENNAAAATAAPKELAKTEAAAGDEVRKIITGSGSYAGQADNHSVEIKEDEESRVFAVSGEAKNKFEALSLNTGDEIRFSYYEVPGSQPVLTDIEKVSENSAAPEIKTGSGYYAGQADNNSIEIRLGSGKTDDFRVFKISDEVRETFEGLSLQTDDEIHFSYYEQSNGGQPVLTQIQKTGEWLYARGIIQKGVGR